jgi:hypothetical protein
MAAAISVVVVVAGIDVINVVIIVIVVDVDVRGVVVVARTDMVGSAVVKGQMTCSGR